VAWILRKNAPGRALFEGAPFCGGCSPSYRSGCGAAAARSLARAAAPRSSDELCTTSSSPTRKPVCA